MSGGASQPQRVVIIRSLVCVFAVPVVLRSENILKVNGSHIRNWWIAHHYVSSVMSIAVLTCE